MVMIKANTAFQRTNLDKANFQRHSDGEPVVEKAPKEAPKAAPAKKPASKVTPKTGG